MARTYIILEAERIMEPGTLDTVLVDADNYKADPEPRLYFQCRDYQNPKQVGTVEMYSEDSYLGTLPTVFVEDTL